MNREAKKDKAEDKMIADFKISASRLIEMIKIIYLSRKTFSAYTKRSTDKYYSTDIRLQGNGIRFIFNKKGKIEAEVWDEIHGLCRMKLVRRSYILEDKEHALITLKSRSYLSLSFSLRGYYLGHQMGASDGAPCRMQGQRSPGDLEGRL